MMLNSSLAWLRNLHDLLGIKKAAFEINPYESVAKTEPSIDSLFWLPDNYVTSEQFHRSLYPRYLQYEQNAIDQANESKYNDPYHWMIPI
jgi:hypothetical protein